MGVVDSAVFGTGLTSDEPSREGFSAKKSSSTIPVPYPAVKARHRGSPAPREAAAGGPRPPRPGRWGSRPGPGRGPAARGWRRPCSTAGAGPTADADRTADPSRPADANPDGRRGPPRPTRTGLPTGTRLSGLRRRAAPPARGIRYARRGDRWRATRRTPRTRQAAPRGRSPGGSTWPPPARGGTTRRPSSAQEAAAGRRPPAGARPGGPRAGAPRSHRRVPGRVRPAGWAAVSARLPFRRFFRYISTPIEKCRNSLKHKGIPGYERAWQATCFAGPRPAAGRLGDAPGWRAADFFSEMQGSSRCPSD